MDSRQYKEIYNQVFGRNDYRPNVTFYDHAVLDADLTEESGRPRYREVTYALIKPTHPDLRVRDAVSHPAKPEEIAEFAEEWAAYQEMKRKQTDLHVPLQAIPGMRLSWFNELRDLGIHDAEALAADERDLGEINVLKILARRIIGVTNETRSLHEGRGEMGQDRDRQVERDTPPPGPSDATVHQIQPTYTSKEEKGGKEDACQTFHYEVRL